MPQATLEPGKTYYVKLFITPGVMSTRTYWTPLKNSGEDTKTAQEIVSGTSRVELIPDKASEWEADEAEDLNERVASFQSGEDEIGHTIGPEHAF